MQRYFAATVAVVFVAAAVQAQEPHRHPPGSKSIRLGVVTFANSGAAGAQEAFLRGLAQFHSFEYDEAAADFREAQQADPTFAMAFWGEALTYSHLLWGEDDLVAARKALARLAQTPEERLAKAGSPRERAFGTAIEALFIEGDLPTRVRGFAASMRKVAADYPDDPEAAALTSLASMFAEYRGKLSPDEQKAARADAISFAERLFKSSPDHPGGAHYLIHATDSPENAPRGLEAARRYAAIAPDAEHALHMPSHIFLQLGLWDDTVASNERAWAASKAEVTARQLSNANLSFHSLQWLQYGYLQQGRYRDAGSLIATAKNLLNGVDHNSGQHVDARYAVGWLEFVHAANTGDWQVVCKSVNVPVPAHDGSDRGRSHQAIAVYQNAIATAMCGTTPAVDAIQRELASVPAGDRRTALLKTALVHATLVAYLRGQRPASDDLWRAAVDAPDQTLVGPPLTLRTNELLGEAYLKAGRPKEAVTAYEAALKTTPNRAAALLGLARARNAAGDAKGSADAYKQLLANWHKADADVAALAVERTAAR